MDDTGHMSAWGVPGVRADVRVGCACGVRMRQGKGAPAGGPGWGFLSPDGLGVQTATVWGVVSK